MWIDVVCGKHQNRCKIDVLKKLWFIMHITLVIYINVIFFPFWQNLGVKLKVHLKTIEVYVFIAVSSHVLCKNSTTCVTSL